MGDYTTKKNLKKYLKKRLGSDLGGASKEIRELFGASMMSVSKNQKANLFALRLRTEIKPQLDNGSITSIEQLDEIINEQFSTLRQVMQCPPLKIKIYKPSTKAIVSAHRGTKKAGGALAGGLLLGPVGAIAGYALASGDGSTTKESIINNNKTFENARIAIYDNKLQIYNKMVCHEGTILFNDINSIDWNERGRVFRLKTNGYGTIVISSKNTSLNSLFDELMLKFNEFEPQISNKETEAPKPKLSNHDPFDTLKKLHELHVSGILTEEEYKSKKAQLLNQI
ncbi:SHOCT domain-containing protein [Methanobacterium formicicum]|jgi:hypothetical protein|uniref:SHOCT domain-containing protein n=1 Tax=Methanobacterium formicicum TaxID=2162 RepID=UPI00248FEE51|nr:SHOCT domain-containing protein [Methanobacterium formicicum]